MNRRYSDFEWLKSELERDSKVSVQQWWLVGVSRLEFQYTPIKMCAAEAHWIMLNLYRTCVDRRRSQIVVPALPGKALKRQLPFRPDEGLFEESFIEERRSGLEQFINRSVNVFPLPFRIFSLCSVCICAGIFREAKYVSRERSNACFPLCLYVCRIAGHPLAQNERCLHMFLQEETIDREYIPGKVRH